MSDSTLHTFAQWTWDVERAWRLAEEHRVKLWPIAVEKVAPLLEIRVLDPAKVETAGLLTHILLVTLPNGKGWWPIDGWETIARAVKEDQPNVFGKILDASLTRRAMVR